ncbi:uncharacterized protein BJX67DRAFT_377985 [Aspergillus lucknowensis]|uniref:Uncharacterized protein n=1 Tax=Aspergillus lucknowensis TaxID=176173 RepID=A0ABR4M1N8_9EURO
MEPSLLDYARYHGIACSYTAIDPLQHIDNALKTHDGNNVLPRAVQLEYADHFHSARVSLEESLQRERLKVPKESACSLASIVHDVYTGSLEELRWSDILPSFHRIDDMKLEPLILGIEDENCTKLSQRPLCYTLHDSDIQKSMALPKTVSLANPVSGSLLGRGAPLQQTKQEKLGCTRDSFSLIQCVRSTGITPVKEIEYALGRLLNTDTLEPEHPIVPLYDHHFTPSPTPISEEHMLPSPVSSLTDCDSCCDHSKLPESKPENCVSVSVGDPSRFETQPCTLPSVLSIDGCGKKTDSISSRTPSNTSIPFNRISDSVAGYNTDFRQNISRLSPSNVAASESPRTQPVKDADTPFEQGTVIECHSKNSGSLSRITPLEKASKAYCNKDDGMAGPEAVDSSHTTTASNRSRQARRPGPSQELRQQNTSNARDATDRIEPAQQRALPQIARANLGSLSSFMETRGITTQKQVDSASPHFASRKRYQDASQKNGTRTPCVANRQWASCITTGVSTHGPSTTLTQTPRVPTQNEDLIIVLSTALLKTHLRIIQYIEGTEHPPTLIYRDYTNSPPQHQLKSRHNLSRSQHQRPHITSLPAPEEADIVLSPKTGIALTTAQATMQLYLPGHKAACLQPGGPKTINSPLRDQIYRLSCRYEQLYILVFYGTEQSKKCKPRVSNQHSTTDKRLLSSMASLTAFCSSMAGYANTTPLLIPSVPEIAAGWILALAHKHACRIPAPGVQSQYGISFTPVNPKPQIGLSLGDMEESTWELFLRRMGLNPYAAHVAMAVLRRTAGGSASDGGYHQVALPQNSAGHLSRFVEMSPDERRTLFGDLLGEGMLKRVDTLIERDWQCDWALNLDGMVQ